METPPPLREIKSLAEVLIQKCLTSSRSSSEFLGNEVDPHREHQLTNLATCIEIVLECFRALSVTPEPILMTVLSPSSDLQHPVTGIHYMLASKDPNLHYTFLACLLAIDVKLWAGVDEAIPSQLQENEVHRIMSFLDGSDMTIRKMVRAPPCCVPEDGRLNHLYRPFNFCTVSTLRFSRLGSPGL